MMAVAYVQSSFFYYIMESVLDIFQVVDIYCIWKVNFT